jgi:hypothetical protein
MNAQELCERLKEPFAADEVDWKPQVVKDRKALAVCYIDARRDQDRLDAVFGPGGWQSRFTVLPNLSVVCTLLVKADGAWVEKTDVGSPSDQHDEGDRTKAAFSDALKRAAVQLGIGRYLYSVPLVWADYDPQRKQFVKPPTLAAQYPPAQKPAAPALAAPKAAANGKPSNQAAAGDSITEGQWQTIQAELKKRSITARAFLAFHGHGSPREIMAGQFQQALHAARQPDRGSLVARADATT